MYCQIQYAHALPHANYHLHVELGGKDDDEAIGGDFGEFELEDSVVAHDTRVRAVGEAGCDSLLVGTLAVDQWVEGAAG